MRFLRVGDEAVLVEVEGTAAALRLYDEARRRGVPADDVVPAARTVLFSGVRDPAAFEADLASWTVADTGAATDDERPVVEVPTVYDGPDLDEVARHWGLTTREVVERHTSVEMVVAFCGFSPGFAYCTGLDAPPVPRRAEPRTRVPAGSVALADVFTGVYPSASPGGWQLLGRTDLVLWDEGRDRPATLAPGVRLRFVEVRR